MEERIEELKNEIMLALLSETYHIQKADNRLRLIFLTTRLAQHLQELIKTETI